MVIHHDIKNELYTIYLLEKGGPIISDDSLEKAIYKFENAFKLAISVLKFEKYKRLKDNFKGTNY
jgi:hypothetical protein